MKGFLIGWAVAGVLAVATLWVFDVTDYGAAALIGVGYGFVCPLLGMWLGELND